MTEIEARPYGPECSPEERRALQDRVYLFAEDVVMWKESPVQTVFQLELFEEKLAAITLGLESFYMLIDLTETQRPSAEIRDYLRQFFAAQTRLTHAAVFTGHNQLLNFAAKFVLGSLGMRAYSVHGTLEEALEDVRRARP